LLPSLSVSVGNCAMAPAPQIHPPRSGAAGDMEAAICTSPRPKVVPSPEVIPVCQISGMIVRAITFQSLLTSNG